MKHLIKFFTLDKLKICLILLIFIALLLPLTSCQNNERKAPPVVVKEEEKIQTVQAPTSSSAPTKTQEVISTEVFTIINKSGTTMDTRINPPEGFLRIPSVKEELCGFLRGLTLKKDGSDVLQYDGLPKSYQDGHAAIFELDTGSKDLQQCADSIIRIYAEYFWSIGEYEKISFHLTNGFLMNYTKWRDGYRIVVNGNKVSWSKTKGYDASYEEFRKYLDQVFMYAGTLSLSEECEPISIDQLKLGDIFLQGGSPGHCVLVVDAATNKQGNQCFLLAQGYMPAQDFHILKNPLHNEDPWYYASELTFPIETPQWTFEEGSLVRWNDFTLNEAKTSLDYSDTRPIAGSHPGAIPAMANTTLPSSEASSSVTLLAVGDNLIHIQVVDSGKQSDGTYQYNHLYTNLKEEIENADIAVVNQETILGGNAFAYSGYPSFNSPTEIGDALIDTGFDVVLQATNHAMDMGYQGVENDLAYWDKHPEIKVLGINKTKEESDTIDIIEENGIKIAMLNYTYGLNGYKLPANMPYLINMLDKKKMSEDIKKAEEEADFTILFPHWGTEYVYEPTKMQKELTDFFYEQGVDLIIGSHPHVLEPVEWIESKVGHRMLVYYSLGNFMSYQKEAPRMLGGMAKVTITKNSNETYISDASITPIVTHYENGPKDYNYAIYKLKDYNEALAKLHSVSELAQNGPITYEEINNLAKQILGTWFID